MPSFQLKNNLSAQHVAIAQVMVTNPELTKKQVAELFDVTPQWIIMLTSTDAFRAHLASLQDEAFQKGLKERNGRVQERVFDLLDQSLDVAEARLLDEDNPAELRDVNRTVEILLGATPLKNKQGPEGGGRNGRDVLIFPVKDGIVAEARRQILSEAAASVGETYDHDSLRGNEEETGSGLPHEEAQLPYSQKEKADSQSEEGDSLREAGAGGSL